MVSVVEVGEAAVAYEVQGDGDPVIMVHGSAGSRAHWMFTTPAMVERNRLVLMEYSGGGETTDAGGPLDVDGLVDQVLGVADAENLDRFHLAGWSLGAVIAAATAARSPERVRSAALICGWAQSDAYMRFAFDLWLRLMAETPELFGRYLFQIGFTPAWFAETGDAVEAVLEAGAGISSGAARHMELDQRVDIADRLAMISSPTLVLGARRDLVVPFEHSVVLADSIKNAELVELDCGHFVPFERPAELAASLTDFFGRH
jgi:pimeloyl-ACP methyl ester carboxylesterase